jgi:dolichyl-diphosphooligosaccharide--protein glycosyltransferase
MEYEKSTEFKRIATGRTKLLFCLVLFLVVYGASVGVRLAEAPQWRDPGLEVQGEKLQATHDAYTWLAGAKGTSRNPDAALARITDWAQNLSGIQYGNLGFWLPAFVAPLVVIPFLVLGRYWNLDEGALPAAILAASCQGFLLRTRLGFYDTDILSLFFPLLVAVLIIITFTPYLRSSWSRKANLPELLTPETLRILLLRCAGIGLVGWAYMWFYSRPSIMLSELAALVFCTLVLTRNWWQAGYLVVGILVVQAVALAGWVGLLTSAVFIGLLLYLPRITAEKRFFLGYLLVFASLVILETELTGQVLGMVQNVLSYAKILPATEEGGLSLPTVKQSIREAQSIDWGNLVQRVAGSWLIFVPAVLGLAYVVWTYPATLVFVPMLGLAIFSFKLGNRFTMYGGPVIGLGLGFGAALLLWRTGLAKSVRVLCLLAIAVLVMLPIWDMATKLRPAPVVSKTFAQSYIDLKDRIPEDARLWQWWDFGYAAQYYAERITFGDGGKHKGPVLYPLATVHATRSSRQASQMMCYITASQEREYARNQTEYKDMNEFWKPYLADPVALLADKGPERAMAFVESLAEEDKSFSEDLPPQYLVLTWQNMSLAYWISHFGNWDLVEGEANPGRIRQVRGEASFNTRRGTVQLRNQQLPLEELTLIRKSGIRTESWPNSSNVYAILNQLSGELYLMDGKIYDSMMIRMLLDDPSQFSDHFELVMDRAPWVRVYRAK